MFGGITKAKTFETLTTLCLARFDSYLSSSTLPGALARLRLVVRGDAIVGRGVPVQELETQSLWKKPLWTMNGTPWCL
jgi:hypothetical protein